MIVIILENYDGSNYWIGKLSFATNIYDQRKISDKFLTNNDKTTHIAYQDIPQQTHMEEWLRNEISGINPTLVKN